MCEVTFIKLTVVLPYFIASEFGRNLPRFWIMILATGIAFTANKML